MKKFLQVRSYLLREYGIYDRNPNEFFGITLMYLALIVAGFLFLQLAVSLLYNFAFWCVVGVALFYLACHAAMWPEDDAGNDEDEEDEDDDLDSIRVFEDQDNDNDQD